jgi:hypothetical protein
MTSSSLGTAPPGKISAAMNRMNFRSLMVIGMPISGQRLSGCPMIVCKTIRPSPGMMR